MILSCSSVRRVRSCVRPETLLTRYLAAYLTRFHQTYISDALWDRDECIKFCVQKVSVHSVFVAACVPVCTGAWFCVTDVTFCLVFVAGMPPSATPARFTVH